MCSKEGCTITATVNEFREAVKERLVQRFPGIAMLDEPGGEEVTAPTMVVQLLTMSQTAMLGGFFSRSFGFGIQFQAPEGAGKIAAMDGVAEELYRLLPVVTIGESTYRSTGLKHEIKEGKLYFQWEIACRMKLAESDDPRMGALEQGAGLK